MRYPRLREIKQLAKGHPAGKWEAQDSNSFLCDSCRLHAAAVQNQLLWQAGWGDFVWSGGEDEGIYNSEEEGRLQAPWLPEPVSLAQLTLALVGNRRKPSPWGPGVCQAVLIADTLSPSALLCPSIRISSSSLQKMPSPLLGWEHERGLVLK